MTGDAISFVVDGEAVDLANPDPTQHLADLLRSPLLDRTGTNVACGEAGCGACTVLVSRTDAVTGQTVRRPINSCVHPVCQLDGVEVTTVEGVGTADALHPVQQQVVDHDASQCGFCTPGFVMSMCGLLEQDRAPTADTIEHHFDGNLCRCTGYRPILDAMHAFDDGANVPPPGPPPAALPARSETFSSSGRGVQWFTPATLEDAEDLLKAHGTEAIVNGNTSLGIYPDDVRDQTVRIDLSRLTELTTLSHDDDGLTVGAGVTLAEFMTYVDSLDGVVDPSKLQGLVEFRRHLERVANAQVRNVATLGGNVAMTQRNVTSAEPFPSDVVLMLMTLGSLVSWWSPQTGSGTIKVADLPTMRPVPLLLTFTIPWTTPGEHVVSFKVTRRHQNAHALVNAAFLVQLGGTEVSGGRLVVGGIAGWPMVADKTLLAIVGQPFGEKLFEAARTSMQHEAAANAIEMPSAGVPTAYRTNVAGNLLYAGLVRVALGIDPSLVPAADQSAGALTDRPVSTGKATWPDIEDEAPVGLPIHSISSVAQVVGRAAYTQDVPAPPRTLHAAYVYATIPNGSFDWSPFGGEAGLLGELRSHWPEVVDLVTVADVPGRNLGGFGGDDPIFCDGTATAYGMPIALVLATDEPSARSAARFAMAQGLSWTPEPAVFTVAESKALPDDAGEFKDEGHVEHLHGIVRPDSDTAWLANPGPVDGQHYVEGQMATGHQVHFYMETQSTLVTHGEPGQLVVHSSTQDLGSVQSTIAAALGMAEADVLVRTVRIGGGYGGKETRPPFFAAAAAVAAHKTGRPVRLVLDRHTDGRMMGGRHPFDGQWWATFDDKGVVKNWRIDYAANGGNTYDVTFPVSDLVVLSADGAYDVPTFGVNASCWRTNRATNTAMRSFGVIQGSLIREDALERVAFELGIRPEDVRERNFYPDHTGTGPAPTTPYGQELNYATMQRAWTQLRTEAGFDDRVAAVTKFNQQNRWRKRGISMTPIKYGVSYTFLTGNQGGALITVNEHDGSVTVATGGVEMGQGLTTKLAQLAAFHLGIDLSLIRMAPTMAEVVPNASSTGASTGADLNGGAVAMAAKDLRTRLEPYCPPAPDGADAKALQDHWSESWTKTVQAAWLDRADLSAQATYKSPELSEVTNDNPTGRPFYYFSYSAACTEVEVDVLTGEVTVLRADVLYDAGHSLNPAVDVGQIHGGFVQGLGYVLSEYAYYAKDGQPYTDGTWQYKIPGTLSIPIEFNVSLLRYDRDDQHPEAPIDPYGIQSSKSTGEPPLVLANSAFFAVKHAIADARRDAGVGGWFPLDAPATPDRVQLACAGVQDP